MIESLVEQIEARFQEAQAQMSDPEVIGDRERYAEAGRLFTQLSTAAKLAEEWRLAVSDAEGAQEMLDEGGEDAEMRSELEDARARIERLEEEIRLAMVERRRQPRLAHEALGERRIAALEIQALEHDLAVQRRLADEIDDRHPASGEHPHDLVVAHASCAQGSSARHYFTVHRPQGAGLAAGLELVP